MRSCPGLKTQGFSLIPCGGCGGKGTSKEGDACGRCKGAGKVASVIVSTIDRRVCADKYHCKACIEHEGVKQFEEMLGEFPVTSPLAHLVQERKLAALKKKHPPCRIGHCTNHECEGRNFNPSKSYVLKHLQ